MIYALHRPFFKDDTINIIPPGLAFESKWSAARYVFIFMAIIYTSVGPAAVCVNTWMGFFGCVNAWKWRKNCVNAWKNLHEWENPLLDCENAWICPIFASLDIQSVNFFFDYDIFVVYRLVYLIRFASKILDAVRFACVHSAKIGKAVLQGKGLLWEEKTPKITCMM